jgi:hypothetical protein
MKNGCSLLYSLFKFSHENRFEFWKMKYLKLGTLQVLTMNLLLEEGWQNFLAGIMQTKGIFGLVKRTNAQND